MCIYLTALEGVWDSPVLGRLRSKLAKPLSVSGLKKLWNNKKTLYVILSLEETTHTCCKWHAVATDTLTITNTLSITVLTKNIAWFFSQINIISFSLFHLVAVCVLPVFYLWLAEEMVLQEWSRIHYVWSSFHTWERNGNHSSHHKARFFCVYNSFRFFKLW